MVQLPRPPDQESQALPTELLLPPIYLTLFIEFNVLTIEARLSGHWEERTSLEGKIYSEK